jgi:putative transposase
MLTGMRAKDERLRNTSVMVTRDAIRRVDLAFQSFFRRVKAKAKQVGYPRFKGEGRYNSFTIGDCGNVLKIQGRVRVSGVNGTIRCRGFQHKPGEIKRLTIKRSAGKWFTRILIEDGLPTPPKVPIVKSVGIDMGLDSFLTTSDGWKVDCPKHYRRLEGKLRNAGRHLSRCKRGSQRRQRALLRLQQVHATIDNCRDDFTHKLSKQIVEKYDLIAVEKLNIVSMVKKHSKYRLSKSILDAGWGKFLFRTSYKAERAGKTFKQGDPRRTSQECSGCLTLVPKDLSVRIHECPFCGLVLDRDVNAARNILARATIVSPPSGSDGVQHTEKCKTAA